MANRTIISVECVIPGDFSELVAFDSNTSLLDADIVLFNPSITGFQFGIKTYQGKTSLDETRSFRLREAATHWRRELADALLAGKTIFIFLNELHEVFIDTGRREYSGTGRSRQTTQILEEFDNYRTLPIEMSVTTSQGKEMRLTRAGAILADYWREFNENSLYKVLIKGKIGEPLIVTRSGAKVVSSLIRNKDSGGTLVVLPFLDMWNETFDEEIEEAGGIEMVWTTEGIAFGNKLLNCLLEIDATLRAASATTPAPDWLKVSDYTLPREATLLQDLVAIEGELESLEDRKGQLKNQLLNESMPRRLLYEKGKPLEIAIVQTLSLIGFSATPYQDDESEFDVIFECAKGRFIGEVEGKDSKPISIEKLRQLEMNIHEDFERDEVSEMAKGVLFGNAYRLKPLNERGEFFTDKCMKAAARSGTALVRTPDLFSIVQYLSGVDDDQFARQCREKIFSTAGQVVEFPEPPISTKIQDEVKQSNTADEHPRSD
ncbi:MAG: hypothetical protein ACYTBX_01630 [Planctomycetota bacterium]|jgi:hypothetical protein